jgi:Tfp pilus assembly protein PilF
MPAEDPPVARKSESAKRDSQVRLEIAFGRMKEVEADSDALKSNPEGQARLRDDARKAYQEALKKDPHSLEAHRCLAGVYLKSNDLERALDTYKKALAKHPKESILWYDLGMYHQRKKELNDSVRCFTKALEMDPENRDYQKKLGFTLAWTGQVEQGLTYLTRVHGTALAHYNVARVYMQKQQNDLARQHLTIALRENSQLVEARELLAQLDGSAARN